MSICQSSLQPESPGIGNCCAIEVTLTLTESSYLRRVVCPRFRRTHVSTPADVTLEHLEDTFSHILDPVTTTMKVN